MSRQMNPTKPYLDPVSVNTRIDITRPSRVDGKDIIRIKLYDEDSHLTVFEGEMGAAEFALSLTGLSAQECPGVVSTATYALGKVRSYEKRDVVLPKDTPYGGGSKWIEENCQEEGWFVDSYIGAQSSTTYDTSTGLYTAHYRVFKYVDKDAS